MGPAAGGLFAQYGAWRWTFGALVILTAAMAVTVAMVLPAGRGEHRGEPIRMPMRSLLILGAAALVVSLAQLPHSYLAAGGLLAFGGILLGAFVFVDRRATAAVLPPSIFGPGREKWIFLTLGLLMAATKANLYVPLLGQRLAHLLPLAAGFLGAALSIGWTVSEFVSASLNSRRVIANVVAAAPLMVAGGLVVAAFTRSDHHSPLVIAAIWAVALLAVGSGVVASHRASRGREPVYLRRG